MRKGRIGLRKGMDAPRKVGMHIRIRSCKWKVAAVLAVSLLLSACSGNGAEDMMSEAASKEPAQTEESLEEPSAKAEDVTAAAEIQSEEDAEEPQTEPEQPAEAAVIEDATGNWEGIVVDAAMHSLTIAAEGGKLYSFVFPEDEEVVETQEGLMLGGAVAVQSEDGVALAVRDGEQQPLADRQALAFAADVLLAFFYQDMESVANLAGYPLFVNLGTEELTVEDGEAFLALPAEEIFTKERVEAVTGCDLYSLEELDGGKYVMAGAEGKPNVIFQKDPQRDSGFAVSGIN